MLSGVKFIARDEVEDKICEEKRRKSGSDKAKRKKSKKKKTYSSCSSDDEIKKIHRGGRRKKKWYSSDERSTSDSRSESEHGDTLNYYRRKDRKRDNTSRDDDGGSPYFKGGDNIRREMGLEWMLKSTQESDTRPMLSVENEQREILSDEKKEANPRELNPYLKDNGSGYPEDRDGRRPGSDQLLSTSLVGDGGTSWRLKALKRAKEQSAREGRNFEEVVEERWGSLGKLAVSAASHTAAPSHAHLHAIRRRRKGDTENESRVSEHRNRTQKEGSREYLRNVTSHHSKMRAPKATASLSWGKQKGQVLKNDREGLVSAAASSLNKFSNDGTFLQKVLSTQNEKADSLESSIVNSKSIVQCKEAEITSEGNIYAEEGLSANKLTAKAMQLRLKGKHEEAQKLLQQAECIRAEQAIEGDSAGKQAFEITRRYTVQDFPRRKDDDDADKHLAKTILGNKIFSLSGQADDEYDFDGPAVKKSRKKGSVSIHNMPGKDSRTRRVLTQQERCIFCFENPNRPKHLVVSIANFTYLMLPQRQPVVPGHCCILPMQHEASTRNVDENVWEEMRNFKKCLIMMFAKQEKELVFIETVMGLAQQRRHCLIECIPLPLEVAKQAPLYFKKAIDEAEDEWSQHNAKKLIDTSLKGLRNSIPKNFPYFHVEFGLNRGFVHVIDDEQQFKSSLGLNVIRGMLQLPEEDMHRHRRHDSVEAQRKAVVDFCQEWEPFDWTKQLD